MEGRSHKSLACIVALLLGLAGVLLCLAGPAAPAGAQDRRSLQVWPDRSVGVSSGLWEGSTAHSSVQVFPFGVFRTSAGDVVRAWTYLHFPLDVFPPGTEVLHATLYVHVDSGSGTGEAIWGAYRVLDPWEEEQDWAGDPGTWPALLSSPIATTAARLDLVTPLPVFTPVPTAVSSPTPAAPTLPLPTPTAMATATPGATLTPTPPTSPLSTPPTSPLPTPTVPPPPTPTSVPPAAPTTPPPTPTAPPPLTVPVVTLGRVTGTWLTWDVTALMRSWVVAEVPDDGLALAPAPDPYADPETAGDLLVARQLTAEDTETRPYVIVEIEVYPVTPTAVPVPVLPVAGRRGGRQIVGIVLIGAGLLLLGMIVRRR